MFVLALKIDMKLLELYNLVGGFMQIELPKLKKFNFSCYLIKNINIYAVILIILNFIGIFDNNFWVDEAYSIELVKNNLSTIIATTAKDVHPPLYYLFLKLFVSILGQHPWVYHFVSFIPYLITVIFICKCILKEFGNGTALLFLTMISLCGNAIYYTMEVRMYSYGALFVLLSFYFYWQIIKTNANLDYVLFSLFSLCAAYTHYYCLLSVAVFYALLMIRAIIKKQDIKKVLIVWIITIVIYLPWMFVLLNALKTVSDDFWLTKYPSFLDSIKFVFSYQSPYLLSLITLFGLIAFLLYKFNILNNNETPDKYRLSLNFNNYKFNEDAWIIIGIISSLLFTIFTGIIVSKLVRPLYVDRYIYPVSTLIWLLLAYVFDHLKFNKLYINLLIIFIIIRSLLNYGIVLYNNITNNKLINETLKVTDVDENDVMLTDIKHLSSYVLKYYYSNNNAKLVSFDDETIDLDKKTNYWLYISENTSKETIDKVLKEINNLGFNIELITDYGMLGDDYFSVYKALAN